MDVTGLSDKEIIALCKLMRLGVWTHGYKAYQLIFISGSGSELVASHSRTSLRECAKDLDQFGFPEINKYGQHPTKVPEINYP